MHGRTTVVAHSLVCLRGILTHAHTHAHTHARAHTHAHTHTHTHTHTHHTHFHILLWLHRYEEPGSDSAGRGSTDEDWNPRAADSNGDPYGAAMSFGESQDML
jgi:hypothetical protein